MNTTDDLFVMVSLFGVTYTAELDVVPQVLLAL